jgi:Di-haem oxidoreductase, putative peroxidase
LTCRAPYGGSLIHSQGIGLYNGVNFVGEIVPRPRAVPGGPATIVAGRRTTPLFGLGLVDAAPSSTFQAIAELEQQLTPATAGRVNVVSDVFADGQAAE